LDLEPFGFVVLVWRVPAVDSFDRIIGPNTPDCDEFGPCYRRGPEGEAWDSWAETLSSDDWDVVMVVCDDMRAVRRRLVSSDRLRFTPPLRCSYCRRLASFLLSR